MQGKIMTKTANRGLENVAQFRYLRTTITNQSLIQEEIKRMNSGNACYHSYQMLLSSRMSKNIKIRIHKTYNLVSDIKGGRYAEGVHIWTKETLQEVGRNCMRVRWVS
jgi:hypothetical protein